MDNGISSAEYLREIANHRRRVKYILYAVNLLQLLVALLPIPLIETHRIEIVVLLVAGFVYQVIYWQYFTRNVVTTSRQILLYSIPYTFSFTAAAYFSHNLLIPGMIIMLVTTTMVFTAKELVVLTLEDLLIVAALFGYDAARGLLTPEMRLSTLYLIIIILSTGLTAAVATFEIKEKERRMVRLEELDRIKTTFIAIVSHNLRTPIAVISGFLEVLDMQKSAFDSKASGIIDGIKQNTRALNELVENTVNISQYQSGERRLTFEAVNLTSLLEELARTKFEPQAVSKNLDLKLDVPQQPCTVEADRRQVGIALTEVIGNAIKFTPLGTVTVSLQVQEARALIKVDDTGPGIPADFQAQMFTQFNRPGNILIYEQKGVGLGLYLTKLIVEAHHGTIWFESREGKGTTFFIALPLKQS